MQQALGKAIAGLKYPYSTVYGCQETVGALPQLCQEHCCKISLPLTVCWVIMIARTAKSC